MKKLYLTGAFAIASCLMPSMVNAQLSKNPDKFLGNITTYGQVNTDGIEYADLWNQITPENESKWASIEGTRDRFSWAGCDRCYNYAKQHDFPFKFHCLVWGAQYPGWLDELSKSQQYREIVDWMDAIKERYPDLPLIDVVNEAVPGHQPAPYKDALGGDGVTGYDWIIKAFEMAHERWPDAILIYNDFNTFQWQRSEFINLVKVLRDAGAPIDAYGCQSHDLTDMSLANFKAAVDAIQTSLKMPMYSTEYDIGTSDDQKQLTQYKNQIPYMWEKDYFAGLTLWGYIYGKTWVSDGNSGIIKDGQDRPAMKWLREYMATDAAINAKGPFPGGVKEASVYIKPYKYVLPVNEPCEVTINARLRTKTIDHIDFYINNKLVETLTEAPYVVTFTPEKKAHQNFKAIVFDTEGNTYERLGGVNVSERRVPFHGEPIVLPGSFECEDFDICGEGASYHDTDTKNEGDVKDYRSDAPGVDLGQGNNGIVVGYTSAGEWLEYTVNMTEKGFIDYEIVASSGNGGATIKLSSNIDGVLTDITNVIQIPDTGDWNEYVSVTGHLKKVTLGEQAIRVTILSGNVNLDKIKISKPGGIDDIDGDATAVFDVFTATGLYLGHFEADAEADLGAKAYELTGQKGVMIVRNTRNGESVKVISR